MLSNRMSSYSEVVRQQREFFLSGATRPLEFRRQQLLKLLAALDEHEASLLNALRADLHRPVHEGWFGEIGLVQAELRHALRHLPRWMRPQRRPIPWWLYPGRARVQPEPLGVVLILGPWNYPVQLLLVPLVSALAAGNCAVLKPSEHAPQTANAITGLIRATFPESYVAVAPGDHTVAEALLQERFDKIFFTGSTAVGRKVMAAAARHLTPVTLELGGKCPCIVCGDAPLAVTARRIAWGKFLNAGQTCVAPDHVWVERPLWAALAEALRQAVLDFYGPDPRLSPHYGRIIHAQHLSRLISLLSHGRILWGGQADPETLYLAPTAITDVAPDSPVMQEEIFGPILPLLPFDHLDTLLRDLSRQPAPLTVYLFTRQPTVRARVLQRLRSGNVCMNDTVVHLLAPHLPFGGLGESGMGSYHGRAGFETFSHLRAVMERPFFPDPRFRYPPPRLSFPTLRRLGHWLFRG